MEYSDGEQTFELPKFDEKLNLIDDKVTNAVGFAEKCKAEYEFLKAVLPKEYLDKKLDGSSLQTVDRIGLAVLHTEVHDAYLKPIRDKQAQQIEEQMDQYSGMMSLVETAQRVSGDRQAFKRVK